MEKSGLSRHSFIIINSKTVQEVIVKGNCLVKAQRIKIYTDDKESKEN